MFIKVNLQPSLPGYKNYQTIIVNTNYIVEMIDETKYVNVKDGMSLQLTEESYNYLCNQLGVTSGI